MRTRFSGRVVIVSSLLSVTALSAMSRADQPLSIVDYMKSTGQDSSYANRKVLFIAEWPSENYTGTADQNTRLLNLLLMRKDQIRVPNPSSNVDGCKDFYENPEISKSLTEAFRENAVKACIVTGTSVPANTIRIKLQEIYMAAVPANGEFFTAAEHKKIHDEAYRAAGCKEDSAIILGWWIVNTQEWPKSAIEKSIQWFGECTVDAEQ